MPSIDSPFFIIICMELQTIIFCKVSCGLLFIILFLA